MTGMTVKEAKKALRKQYVFNIVTKDPEFFYVFDDETWKVTKQSVEPGKIIKYSDEITLTCEEIKEETSEATETDNKDNKSQSGSKKNKKKETANNEKKTKSENQDKLEAFVGKRCLDVTNDIKDLGYTPCYIAANTNQDMTSQIEYELETSYFDSEWIIANMTGIDEETKIATYIVTSKVMRDNY